MKFTHMAAVAGLTFTLATGAGAVTSTFNVTYDGSTASIDAGSDTPGGTVMNAGDGFLLTLSTAGDDFWRVDGAYDNVFIPLTFAVFENATRTADIVTNFMLDGSIVATIIDNAVSQSQVHVGAQRWSLALGLEFDQVVMDYSLTAIDTMGTSTIRTVAGIFSDFSAPDKPFYNSPSISYNAGISPIPLPAGLPLILAGLAGLGLVSRRRKAT